MGNSYPIIFLLSLNWGCILSPESLSVTTFPCPACVRRYGEWRRQAEVFLGNCFHSFPVFYGLQTWTQPSRGSLQQMDGRRMVCLGAFSLLPELRERFSKIMDFLAKGLITCRQYMPRETSGQECLRKMQKCSSLFWIRKRWKRKMLHGDRIFLWRRKYQSLIIIPGFWYVSISHPLQCSFIRVSSPPFPNLLEALTASSLKLLSYLDFQIPGTHYGSPPCPMSHPSSYHISYVYQILSVSCTICSGPDCWLESHAKDSLGHFKG